MIRTFTNWLRLDAQNLITEVWWAVLILWIALVTLGILSVRTQSLTFGAKLVWIAAIVALPLLGLFAYCTFCLTRVDYHMIDFLFQRRRGSQKKLPALSPQTGRRRNP